MRRLFSQRENLTRLIFGRRIVVRIVCAKIVELVENLEACLFSKIPRKKEMSLRISLKYFKTEYEEKMAANFYTEPITFILE